MTSAPRSDAETPLPNLEFIECDAEIVSALATGGDTFTVRFVVLTSTMKAALRYGDQADTDRSVVGAVVEDGAAHAAKASSNEVTRPICEAEARSIEASIERRIA
jgi:hypothetical protein